MTKGRRLFNPQITNVYHGFTVLTVTVTMVFCQKCGHIECYYIIKTVMYIKRITEVREYIYSIVVRNQIVTFYHGSEELYMILPMVTMNYKCMILL